MAYEQKDNTGSTFKNDRKVKDSHPDFTGTVMIDGVEYWMSTWVKVYEKDGQKRKFFSHSFQPKQEQKKDPVQELAELDDDIPF